MSSCVLCFLLLFAVTGGIFADKNDECPTIILKQEWSIMPQAQSIGSLNLPVNYAIISHTATEPCNSRYECALRTRVTQVFHVEAKGLEDIAYSFLIGGDGNVYEGRGWTKQGAHSFGWNNKSISISFIGTFNDIAPSQVMLNTARKLLTCGKANGSLSNDVKVLGQRQISNTPSPGQQLYNIIQTWPEWKSLDTLKNNTEKNITANEDFSQLRFIERQAWNAQPPSADIESINLPVPYAIITQTASSPCYTQSECVLRTRLAQTLHIESSGFDDIAYSFLIGGDGNVYVGRGWHSVGGHTFGWNNKSLGIAFIGTFNDIEPSAKMLDTARKLLAFGKARGYLSNDLIVLGHRQVADTLSPGQQLYNIIQTWPEWKSLDSLKKNTEKNITPNEDFSQLRFIERHEWLAQPPTSALESLNLPVHYAIISHTASSPCEIQSACVLRARLIQTLNIESYGWNDIGASFLIGGDGSVYVGRGWNAVGAHSFGWNNKSIGIAFIGTFNDIAPSAKMLDTARKLLAFGKARGYLSNDLIVLGHRQVSETLSPGQQLYNIIQTWPEWKSLDSLKNNTEKNITPNEDLGQPRFIERQGWDAQPPSGDIESLNLPVPYAIISHTGSSPCNRQSDCVIRTRMIQTIHMESFGWDDIGYSFLIGGDGNIYVGRGWHGVGAHTFGWNNKSIGIAFIGTFNDIAPSQKMLDAARFLLAFGKQHGYLRNDLIVLGHRQVSATLSPGQQLYNIIQTWPEWKPLNGSKNSGNNENGNCSNIISRQQWSAQPPTNAIETLTLPVPYVVISHTATQQCNQTRECIAKVRLVQTYHIDALGWADIAYAFLIGGDGNVYEGRGWTKRGNHVSGWNDKSFGIAFIGNFNNDTPSQKMLTAARKLLACGKTNGKLSNNFKVLGHRQVSNTISPGNQLYAAIQNWPEWSSQI